MQEEDKLFSQKTNDFFNLKSDVEKLTNHEPNYASSSTDSDDNNQDDNNQDDNNQDNRNPTGQTPLEYVQDIMDGEPMDVSDPDG